VTAGERGARQWRDLGFKKFDTILIEGKLRTVGAAVLFSRRHGEFGANFLGVTFGARDLESMESAMRKHLAAAESYTFERFIEVDYDAKHRARRTGLDGKRWGSENEAEPISGFSIEFVVYEISNEFPTTYHGGTYPAKVWRRMELTGDEWTVAHEETVTVRHESTRRLIPFTESRYSTLIAVSEALQGLHGKLESMFGDGVADAALVLDALGGRFQLGAGAPTDPPQDPGPTAHKARKR
jgi:hypothetical protein